MRDNTVNMENWRMQETVVLLAACSIGIGGGHAFQGTGRLLVN